MRQRQLGDEFVEQRLKAPPGRLVSGLHCPGVAIGADHDVDRPVREVPAIARQRVSLGRHRCQPSKGPWPIGHGFAAIEGTKRRAVGAPSWCHAPLASTCDIGRTKPMWPPSAR